MSEQVSVYRRNNRIVMSEKKRVRPLQYIITNGHCPGRWDGAPGRHPAHNKHHRHHPSALMHQEYMIQLITCITQPIHPTLMLFNGAERSPVP